MVASRMKGRKSELPREIDRLGGVYIGCEPVDMRFVGAGGWVCPARGRWRGESIFADCCRNLYLYPANANLFAMEMNWIDGFRIEVALQGGAVVVSANREGLLSLANHLQALCEEPARGAHFHLDATTALEDGSLELIVERVE